ncbi:MAG: exo-alpha-sialidase, partial [Pirellulales bacterium]|nr:exo-alpha-sialidase [Pirellulales bacterium]
KNTLDTWHGIGMPDVDAPRGGRAMIAKSTDNGVTWSKPVTLLDSPFDDRHPAITELSDGTLLCSLFTYPSGNEPSVENDPAKTPLMGIVRSLDGGKTWEKDIRRMPLGFTMSATDGPPLEMPDGSILLAGEAQEKSGQMIIAVFRSTDRGASWRYLSKVTTDYKQHEPSLVRLKDGKLVMISRPEGTIVWSSDDGKTWTEPVTFGFRMFAPTLLVMADGTLLCHYGSYNHGGLRAIFSTDGGHTWVAASKNQGFLIDQTYGYSRSCLMPDGSAYLAYIGTGGHRTKQAENNMIWSIRLRVRDDHSGIELLPVDSKVTGGNSIKMPNPGKPVKGI